MMDVMIANVGSEPGHEAVCLQEARRFQSCLFIGPTRLVAKGNAGKIVLSVEEIGADGVSDEVRNGLREQQRLPPKEQGESNADYNVNEQSNQAIQVFAGIINEGVEAHSVNEHEQISKQDGERMAHELVFEAFYLGGPQILLPRHNRKGADVRAPQFGIMVMMIIMGAAPNAAGGQGVDSKNPHQDFGQPRSG